MSRSYDARFALYHEERSNGLIGSSSVKHHAVISCAMPHSIMTYMPTDQGSTWQLSGSPHVRAIIGDKYFRILLGAVSISRDE